MDRLAGKKAIITGAGRGIGRAIALAFAKEGADLLLVTRSTPLDSLLGEIKESGGNAIGIAGNVASREFAGEIVKKCRENFGQIDILVNNAGITRDGLLVRMSEENFDDVIETNLKGAFNCLQAVSKIMMKQRSGSIINISSVVGLSGNPGQVNYSASKAGMIGMTKSSALELASRNIRVNAVAPGFIQSDMTDALAEKAKEEAQNKVPMGRFGSSDDVALGVIYLASDESSYVTGQTLSINGGIYM